MSERISLLVVVALVSGISGCGGPSRAVLDRADRETKGLASSEFNEIRMPQAVRAGALTDEIDSYNVAAQPVRTRRPSMTQPSESRQGPADVLPAARLTGPSSQVASIESSLLDIGDVAPPLAIAGWVKGTPLEGFDPGTVYVVEFWATWCGPCKMNMPHLSQLQQQYGSDVRFVGISDETEDVVNHFLTQEAKPGQTWNDILHYTIAVDHGRATKKAYMVAAGERGIPCAFVVGKTGVVEWIGHPARIDEPLAAIVSDGWDVDAARLSRNQQKRFSAAFSSVRKQLGVWLNQNQHETAINAIDAVVNEFPDATEPLVLKLDVLRKIGRFDETYVVIERIVQKNWNDANLLSQLAWLIAAETEGEGRDLDLALRSAQRSVELTGEEAPIALDALARVYFEKGDVQSAIVWQTKAVAGGGKYAAEMTKALQRYQQALP